MKTAAIINKDRSVDVILYDNDRAIRKVTVFNDGRVAFRDYGDQSKSKEFIVLAPVRKPK